MRLTLANRDLGQIDVALQNLDQAIAETPDSPALLMLRAALYIDQRNYIPALRDLDRLIALAPTAEAYYERARANLFKDKLPKVGVAAAVRDFNAALRLRPDYPAAMFDRAYALYEGGDLPAAAAGFTQVIQLGTYRLADAHGYRGRARQKMSELHAALADLTKAIELDPTNHRNLLVRGSVFSDLKNYSSALRDKERAVAMTRDVEALFSRGTLYYRMKRFDDAIADMTEAMDREPAAEGFKDMALVKLEKGDAAGAIVACNAALQLDPRQAPALRLRYLAKLRQNDYADAQMDLDAYLMLMPDSVEALLLRGQLRYNAQQINGAVADFDQAIALAPKNPDAYYGRGITSIRAGQPAQSLLWFERALALDSRYAKAYMGRAEAHLAMQDFNAALAATDAGLAIVPDSTDLRYTRASAYYMLKDYARAVEECDLFLKADTWPAARTLRDRAAKKLSEAGN